MIQPVVHKAVELKNKPMKIVQERRRKKMHAEQEKRRREMEESMRKAAEEAEVKRAAKLKMEQMLAKEAKDRKSLLQMPQPRRSECSRSSLVLVPNGTRTK